MGRPPCCDKDGIKKGPWTPEEDIILVSYIQQHGPGNWRSVPTNTGLQRCSKSCRLRWTNYLRPGIKRGNFTPHEEGMIIHLQAILGNKWAAIASYLPQRTDNDIKNYWNTHLKKKLKRFQSNLQQEPQATTTTNKSDTDRDHHHHLINNNYDDHHGHNMVTPHQPSSSSSSSTTTCYASSTENISRLLESWMKCPTSTKANVVSRINNFDDMSTNNNNNNDNKNNNNNNNNDNNEYNDVGFDHHVCEEDNHFHQYDTMLSFDNNLSNHKIIGNVTNEGKNVVHDENMDSLDDDDDENNPPLTFLEKWLLDESTTSRQVADEILRLPSIF